ncbi:MAG: hypothetical protein ACI9K3_000997 [Halovenus sp.]|jgi:hypothetical protein
MDREALRPVAMFVLTVVLLTSAVSGTIEQGTNLPVVYADAVYNGGMALVLAALLLLFESFSYGSYRRVNPPLDILSDGLFVFAVAAVATGVSVAGLAAAGLGGLDVSGFDVSSILSGLLALVTGVYAFYTRNPDSYRPPTADGSG